MDRIKKILERYYEGNSSHLEELELMKFFSSSNIDPDLLEYRAEFEMLNTIRKMHPPNSIIMPLITNTNDRNVNRELYQWKIFGRTAASIALLLIGYLIASFDPPWQNAKLARTVELAKVETERLRTQLILELIEEPITSKRLIAHSEANKLTSPNKLVTEALFTTLQSDSDVNVRIAAVESLSKLVEDPKVREGIIKSLEYQESPLVILKLVKLMILFQENESLNSIEKLLQRPQINETIKKEIEKSIQNLI